MALIPVGQRIIEQFQMHDTQQAVLTNNVQGLIIYIKRTHQQCRRSIDHVPKSADLKNSMGGPRTEK